MPNDEVEMGTYRKGGKVRPLAIANRSALKLWMKEGKIKVTELAKLLGVCLATVYAWRKGYPPSPRNAALIEKLSNGAVPFAAWY